MRAETTYAQFRLILPFTRK